MARTFWGLLTRTAATIAAHTLLRACFTDLSAAQIYSHNAPQEAGSITPASILRIAHSLLAGTLLSDQLPQQINDGCLGWDCPAPFDQALLGTLGGFDTLQTFMGTVIDRIPVVIVTNSPGRSLDTVLTTAFQEARVP